MQLRTVVLARAKTIRNGSFFSTNILINSDNITNPISYYFSLLKSSPNPKHLCHLHGRLLRTGLYSNVILSSKLVMMYSTPHNLISHSLSVFLHMPERNIYSWNIIIGEFSRLGLPEKSVELFLRMQNSEVQPDVFTFPLVLRACASAGSMFGGMSVHGLCVKVGLEKNVFVASALVFLYVSFGRILMARKLFDEMPERDAVLWTAMLAGYAQHEEPMLGLVVFREMVGEGIQLDAVVMVSLLLICSQLGWLRHGKSVQGWSIRRCLHLGLSLGNAFVHMYVKCASLSYAQKIFNVIPETDVISWSALILGYGINGSVNVALDLFDLMCREGFEPNDVTFLGVLSACAHAGMVQQAHVLFDMMKDYKVMPELKHYACMVDCLGRAGLLEEAERFIEEMPVEPDGAVLGALLGGCRVHGNIEVGERIAKKLLGLEPEKGGYYVLLANIYAAAGRFDDAEEVRELMKQENVNKLPGSSLIELESRFHLSITKK
ncbi:pentatricopeptide repeat-containing protein At4g14170 [Macadamia integrifolia]|uniref:pentatricopeptide repeat-containing protein At4g14170 n=1 Tax=Macadamia integrifolia TaxID=60698 RepID=UPI001C4E7B89|nr:pentatricopeptide repeat-containing protein At4g14170 [Macadamia integrifolia]